MSTRRFNKLASQTEIADNSSEEYIVKPPEYNRWLKNEVSGGGSQSGQDGNGNRDGITVTTRVEVNPDTSRQYV